MRVELRKWNPVLTHFKSEHVIFENDGTLFYFYKNFQTLKFQKKYIENAADIMTGNTVGWNQKNCM